MSTLRHLRAPLYALDSTGRWRWQPSDSDDEGRIWELVHEASSSAPSVYAPGETPSPQARAIAFMHPGVLRALNAADEKNREALERLQRLTFALELLLGRPYNASQRAHYRNLRWALVDVGVLTRLLQAEAMPTLEEMEEWQEDLLNPDGNPKGL